MQVYADATPNQFTLYEDDGSTLDYDQHMRPVYRTRTTLITQQQTGNVATVVIDKAVGNYSGAVTQRRNIVRLLVQDARALGVKLNGTSLPQKNSAEAFASAATGWFNAGRNLVLIKSGVLGVAAKKTFTISLQAVTATASVNLVCDNGWAAPGDNVYVVGNQAALGHWNLGKAIKLQPSVYYEYIYNPPPGHHGPGPSTPKWSGVIRELPANSSIEWKCVKQLAGGQWQWQSGNNNVVTTPTSGFSGTSVGAF
jgi:alpha-glucosidase